MGNYVVDADNIKDLGIGSIIDSVQYCNDGEITYSLLDVTKDAFDLIKENVDKSNESVHSSYNNFISYRRNVELANILLVKLDNGIDVFKVVKDRHGAYYNKELVSKEHVSHMLDNVKRVAVYDRKNKLLASNFLTD